MNDPDRIWLKHYPPGVPADINPDQYASLPDMLEESFRRYADRPAFECMGARLRYRELDQQSAAVAAWLQSDGLKPGTRVAIMLPNVLQYPVVLCAVLRAGGVVVNVNPLYTARELAHQLRDSGAEFLFVLENFAHVAQAAIPGTATRRVVVCAMGDMFAVPKRWLVNLVVRRIRKLVPPYALPQTHRLDYLDVKARGAGLPWKKPEARSQDVAVLQYTGGTTGVSKGAMLSHRNLIANTLQSAVWHRPGVADLPEDQPLETVTALPLYHIYALTVCALLTMHAGGLSLLIPNPRDIPGFIRALRGRRFNIFPGVNTLFNALANHPDFAKLDFSSLRIASGGGMAVQAAVAERWFRVTGRPILEGYGLSETSPVATGNRLDATRFSGNIGYPVPSTWVCILDDEGRRVPNGTPGEIAVKGPQVMLGYWQRPEETARVMTADGFLRTGDIGIMDDEGATRIVDRKKDMILVSGFNVYPNEVEEAVALHPAVMECAVVGVPSPSTGDAVKLFVVARDASLTEAQLIAHCHQNLAGYKCPKLIEFRDELPKSNVGKILRRELRQR